jgi:hypothetical protein
VLNVAVVKKSPAWPGWLNDDASSALVLWSVSALLHSADRSVASAFAFRKILGRGHIQRPGDGRAWEQA